MVGDCICWFKRKMYSCACSERILRGGLGVEIARRPLNSRRRRYHWEEMWQYKKIDQGIPDSVNSALELINLLSAFNWNCPGAGKSWKIEHSSWHILKLTRAPSLYFYSIGRTGEQGLNTLKSFDSILAKMHRLTFTVLTHTVLKQGGKNKRNQ